MTTNQCLNYEFCGNNAIPEIGQEFCMTCGSWFKYGFGWNKLTFVNTSDSCVICCSDISKQVLFPTGCGHMFCISCTKDLLYFDETRYHKSPVTYGCPPCPNGCQNPEIGKQCYCLEYDTVIDTWEQNDKQKWSRWDRDQERSIEDGMEQIQSSYGRKKCPLCRAVYTRSEA